MVSSKVALKASIDKVFGNIFESYQQEGRDSKDNRGVKRSSNVRNEKVFGCPHPGGLPIIF